MVGDYGDDKLVRECLLGFGLNYGKKLKSMTL
jgi:hypothetical protein